MKKLLLSGVCLVAFFATSQTVLFEDDFELGGTNWTLNGGTGLNQWIINNQYLSAAATFGFIADTPNQPGGITNSPNSTYLHIYSAQAFGLFGISNSIFDTGSASNQNASMNSSVSTAGMSDVTVDFWYICAGSSGVTYGTLQYSTNGGANWENAATYSGVGSWTQASVSLPAWDNQPNFRIRFNWTNGASGVDPAFAVDEVVISATAGGGNSITTTNDVSPADWCFNSTESGTVNFVAAGTFTAGNTYTAQLSDASGSFVAPTSIGSLASTANGSLSINTTIPSGIAVGTGYRVRVVSSAPSTIGTDNATNLIIHALPTVSLPPFAGVCETTLPFVLDQGTPANGDYSGNGVVFGFFNPSEAGIGTHDIMYTYYDGNGCSNSATQSITVDDCASLDELSQESFVLYPNPTLNEFSILTSLNVQSLQIVDVNGKTVKSFTDGATSYDISDLVKGVYFVKVQAESMVTTLSLIKE